MSDFGEQYLIDVFLDVRNKKYWDRSIGDPAAWKRSVLHQLQKISSSDAGLCLLKAIRSEGHRCLIVPPDINSMYSCNSAAYPTDPWEDPTADGVRRMYVAMVEFDPSLYLSTSPCFRHKRASTFKYGNLPDEVLFHELTHAFRIVRGSLNRGTQLHGGAEAVYSDSEEFLAIVLSNIYISDITNPRSSGLRGGHLRHDHLDNAVATSVSFFKSNPQVLPILREFVASAPAFCKALCNVRAAFNPIRALFDPSLARLLTTLAGSREAAVRDALAPAAQAVANMVLPDLYVDPLGYMKSATQILANDLAKLALGALGR
jgi:hypothetical protein